MEKYDEFRKKFEENKNDPLIAVELSRLTTKWLKDHIKVHDKDFAEYYFAHTNAQPV